MTEEVSIAEIKITEEPLCPICCKSVNKYEKVELGGLSFHVGDCFRCGLDGNVGCGKNLHRDNFFEQLGKPFCAKCFSKHFLIGFGAPQSNKQDFLNAVKSVTSPSPVKVTSPPSSNNGSNSNDNSKSTSEPLTVNNGDEQLESNIIVDASSSSPSSPTVKTLGVNVAKGTTAAKVQAFSPTGKLEVKKCRNCTKTVYPAELCIAGITIIIITIIIIIVFIIII